MKKSYRLPGVFWDHRPESISALESVAYNPFYLKVGHPECLFDYNGKHRCISLTELLSLSSQTAVDSLARQLLNVTAIAIICDYKPEFYGSIANKFFQHRIRQALRLLEDLVPDTAVTLMQPPNRKSVS
ncbi:hypothetical protein [Bifidobacterium sp. UTCIF-39]|uniref:hypothetical protein n=1 Tax=Bifidobacterium sp. UTCIF-39 TaxID=1465359 RepID=UPI001128276C|nr:hypothetical protein [Bifidobacterium sp. UTCIF-39]